MTTTIILASLLMRSPKSGPNLVANPTFDRPATTPSEPLGYSLQGASRWAFCGYSDETPLRGIVLKSYSPGVSSSGTVSQTVTGIDQAKGRWIRFTFVGRAEEGFSVKADQLYMKVDFYAKNGSNYVDSVQRLIYREVAQDRKDFTVNGDYAKKGSAVWRTYELEELLPFPEIDTVQLTVGFKGGDAKNERFSNFYVTDFALTQSTDSVTGKSEPKANTQAASGLASVAGLLPLGGRWYYEPAAGERIDLDGRGRLSSPLTVNESNADRLFYRDDRLVNPFAGNMSAWMRAGYKDLQGNVLTQDRFVQDSVTLTFDGSGYMKVFTRNLPNHQTAKFPDTFGTQGYNPSYIQEHADTYYLPLDPKPNPQAVSMTDRDSNYALNMGPIGIAVNGVVFYNPFDAEMTDASSIMDRCCGHPSPDNRYHYHKYPICVNTPFVDKGEAHSPIIGFALDGFPVYGPYESKGEMAKDSKANPLNAFNAHFDPIRGWHYHATPGKYPYLIGGYLGTASRTASRG